MYALSDNGRLWKDMCRIYTPPIRFHIQLSCQIKLFVNVVAIQSIVKPSFQLSGNCHFDSLVYVCVQSSE